MAGFMNKKQLICLCVGIVLFVMITFVVIRGVNNSMIDRQKAIKIFLLFNFNTLVLTAASIYLFKNKE